MSNRFHNKFHRENHHSVRNVKNQDHVDASYDPIASFDSPFQGEFYSEGDILTTENLSAQKELFVENANIKSDLTVSNNATVVNDLNVQQNLLVNGNGEFDGNLTIDGNLTVLGSATQLDTTVIATSAVEIVNYGTGPGFTVTQHGTEPIAHFVDANGDDIIFQDNGYVGLGTDLPNEKLTIVGNVSSTGNLFLNENGYIEGNLAVSSNASVSGDLTVSSNLSVDGNSVITSNAYVSGDVYIGGSETVTSNSFVSGDSFVAGNSFVSSNAFVSGSATVQDNLYVTSNVYVSGSTHLENDLFVTSNVHVSGNVLVENDVVLTSNVFVSGNQSIDGDLNVTSNAFISGNGYIGENLTITQNVSSQGTSTIGTLNVGTTDDVITKDSNNTLETRPINHRVWDTSANLLSGSLTQNVLPKFDTNSTLIDSNIYDDGTFVGINTTSPTDTFTVAGSSKFFGNVTIFGDLTATGTSTFANTLFSTTSALSVVHIGEGPAAWIGNSGTGDIASFYDIDAGVEVLHVGGNNGDFPNVGVKTSQPNVDFTVNGQISASEELFAKAATFIEQITSNGATFLSAITLSNNLITNVLDPVALQDASTKNYVDTEVDTLSTALQTNLNIVETNLTTSLTSLSSETFETINNVETSLTSSITGLSSELYEANEQLNVTLTDTITGLSAETFNAIEQLDVTFSNLLTGLSSELYIAINDAEQTLTSSIASLSVAATEDINLLESYLESSFVKLSGATMTGNLSVVGSISATEIIYGDASGLYNIVDVGVRSLSGRWDSTYETVKSLSSTWEESAEILPTVTNYLSTSNVLLSSLTVIEGLNADSLEVGAGPTSLFVANSLVGINTETPNTDLTVNGSISSNEVVYVNDGNSNQWNSVYSSVSEASANWESTYNTFFSVSSTFLTSETDSQTIAFNESNQELSISNGNTVSLSALLDDSGIDAEVRTLTGNWENTYSSVSQASADWDSVYSSVSQASADFVLTDTSNTTPGVSAVTKILAVSALPTTPEPETLYIVI